MKKLLGVLAAGAILLSNRVGQSQKLDEIETSSFDWKIEIVYPDKEIKTFALSRKGGKLVLRSVVWICNYSMHSAREESRYGEVMGITCTTKDSSVLLNLACSTGPTKLQDEQQLLFGLVEKKTKSENRIHSITIKCSTQT